MWFTQQGVIKRGFAVGELEELLDQARRGGVRLPGRHRVKYGHSCVYTDPAYDVKDLVRPRNIIRVGGDGELAACTQGAQAELLVGRKSSTTAEYFR